MAMLDKLDALQQKASAALEALTDVAALEAWHAQYLSRRGELTQLLRSVGQLPPEERPGAGRRANEFKAALEVAYEQRQADLKRQARAQALTTERVDVTLPGRPPSLGRLHLSTQALRRIYAIFADMGFQVYRAPDVETDELNFELLNMPPHHPAREMWDTFYTTREGVLLRTHTSPGQIRAMRQYCPEPIRVILPGMCYRYEQVTARSEMMFYQVEGLAVGKQITMTDLKGTMAEYARRMFGADRQMRFRASYFPFTEPSVEVDMDCILCGGEGCRVCKYTGWLEVSGAGMVHPVVLYNGGYDPDVYSGFAFGMGVERPAMLIHGIDDIRSFFSNDLRFLEQF
ncbi:MAG: phenylalanine--tRNA ligase subunit alpha [Anaerolineae bacterium]|nr:MAG: phenylalanine--tRNA ligase subunit alpha [Anaerolineae bacterium]